MIVFTTTSTRPVVREPYRKKEGRRRKKGEGKRKKGEGRRRKKEEKGVPVY